MGNCSLCSHNSFCYLPVEANIPNDPNNQKPKLNSAKANLLIIHDLPDNNSSFITSSPNHKNTTISNNIPLYKPPHQKQATFLSQNTKQIKHTQSKVKLFMKLSTIKQSLTNTSKKLNRMPTTEQFLVSNKTIKQTCSFSKLKLLDSKNQNITNSIITQNPKIIKNSPCNLNISFNNPDYMMLYTNEKNTKESENQIEENGEQNSFEIESIEVTNEQENKMLNMLCNHYLFKHFDEKMLQIIIDNSQGFQIDEGTIIYNEGEKGESFFIIQEGQVQITSSSNPKERKVLSTGESFGDIALIYNNVKRNETAIALTNLAFYVIFGSSYRETSKNYSKHSIEQIIDFINNNIWLCCLDQVIKLNLASLAINEEYTSNQILLSKHNKSFSNDKIFLIKNGSLSIKYISNTHTKTKKLFNKDSFGEIEVILNYDIYEEYDLISSSDTTSSVYILTKEHLIKAIGINYKEIILMSIFNNSINKNNFFKTILLECYYTSIYSLFQIKTYTPGSFIYKSNSNEDENVKALILLHGKLINEHNKTSLVSKGELYGDEIINSSQNISNNIISSNDDDIVITFECTWMDIRDKLKELSKNSSLDVFKRANKLTKMQMFRHLNESRILELCQLMKKAKFNKGNIIIHEGSDVMTFYVIYKGRVKIQKKGILIREVEEGNCFGEINILSEDKSEYTIIADTHLQCYTLSKEIFMKFLIDEKLNEYIKTKMCLEDTNIDLNDLYYIKLLGKGRFGTVSLVHNQISLYAIKTIPKKYIDSSKQLGKYLLIEKNILLSLDFPLIVKLVKTLKNENLCFLLMEYINGVNLEECEMNKIGKNQLILKFFAACMVLTLDYLNKKSLAHRDIKPANIILDTITGYFKLLDFGTAKKIRDFTFTVIGTPTCMAPELILGKGYSFPIDYWSLGVSMYYLYYGKYPFGHNSNDIIDIYNQIIHQELSFPFEINDSDLRQFISNLLNKTPIFRLCSFEKIREDSLFKGFNWKELKELKLKSPYFDLNNNNNTNGKNCSKEVNGDRNMNLLKNIRQPFLQYINCYKFDIYPQIQNNEGCQHERDVRNWFEEF